MSYQLCLGLELLWCGVYFSLSHWLFVCRRSRHCLLAWFLFHLSNYLLHLCLCITLLFHPHPMPGRFRRLCGLYLPCFYDFPGWHLSFRLGFCRVLDSFEFFITASNSLIFISWLSVFHWHGFNASSTVSLILLAVSLYSSAPPRAWYRSSKSSAMWFLVPWGFVICFPSSSTVLYSRPLHRLAPYRVFLIVLGLFFAIFANSWSLASILLAPSVSIASLSFLWLLI